MIKLSWLYTAPSAIVGLAAFLLVLLFAHLGHRIRLGRVARNPLLGEMTIGSWNAFLGLLALILAFSFNLSEERYDDRRRAAVEEAGAIQAAALCADLFPEAERQAFRSDLRNYLEARIDFGAAKRDPAQILDSMGRMEAVGMRLWQRAAAMSREPAASLASAQMLIALDRMRAAGTDRNAALQARMPDAVVVLLIVMVTFAGFLIGYGYKGRGALDCVPVLLFSVLASLVIFVILDFDHPARGLINLDKVERFFLPVRQLLSRP